MAEPRNVADPAKIKKDEKKVDVTRSREMEDLRFVLSDKRGRRFMWRLMARCKTFESIFETNARIYYNAGQQEFGHFLMGEVVAVREEALLEMMKEAKEFANG